jgi:hypothetical protein
MRIEEAQHRQYLISRRKLAFTLVRNEALRIGACRRSYHNVRGHAPPCPLWPSWRRLPFSNACTVRNFSKAGSHALRAPIFKFLDFVRGWRQSIGGWLSIGIVRPSRRARGSTAPMVARPQQLGHLCICHNSVLAPVSLLTTRSEPRADGPVRPHSRHHTKGSQSRLSKSNACVPTTSITAASR